MSHEMIQQFEAVGKKALEKLREVRDANSLEQFRIEFLSRKGEVTALLGQLGKLPKELKPIAGQLANKIKNDVTEAFEQAKAKVNDGAKTATGPLCDVTLPGRSPNLGGSHLITRTINELLDIFARMGFEVGYGPEVEDEYHNFVALNIDPSHPARDVLDNFYITDDTLLRTQTSAPCRFV